jgi:hypothetical protein
MRINAKHKQNFTNLFKKNLMKNVIKSGLMLLAAGLMFTACEKSETQPATAPDNSAGNKMIDLEQIATYLHSEGLLTNAENGNGAVFMTPGFPGSGFFVLKDIVFDPSIPALVDGEIGGFSADYGPNDFWRENPDGTVSVQLSSNAASASYTDFGTGESYSGTGNMHMIYTGEVLVLTVPFPPFEITLIVPGARNAVSMTGTGKVTLNGEPGMEHNLSAKINNSASQGGQSNVTLEFN